MDVEQAWDALYEVGRYVGNPPVPFTEDIVAAARKAGATSGVYIGCGNGRNLVPLITRRLDLIGLDISATALRQLAARAPHLRDRLVHGDLDALPAGETYPLVIGIQVFQHGDRETTHAHLRAAQRRTAPGGLFCLRVHAIGTDVGSAHEVVERHGEAFTVRYTGGEKRGMLVHYFERAELDELFADEFEPVLPLRIDAAPQNGGQWLQWEAIWRRR
ncbi:methyltransferase family protein [Herbihabitans rhizosphaerae]|uniref:Methyltransferase family protein n=1 Tax=Herbihabitans rhizosphaerae TaxID=1872711 RepID=A0A4Q7L723_9PSEU|nr:class I SAM-dependent methyltransferase [Herbihabitans rhizosphaerae]RZS44421.1 methyltransferase family protein [Herbihabitans rhizosphaerae]